MRLDVRALALAGGIVGALSMFFLAWWLMLFVGVSGEIVLLSVLYKGYAATAMGSVIGLMWGFIDGLVGGALIAFVYNRFVSE